MNDRTQCNLNVYNLTFEQGIMKTKLIKDSKNHLKMFLNIILTYLQS